MRQKNLQTHHGYLSQRILHAPSTTSPSASSKNIHSSFQNFTKQTLNNRNNAEDIVLIHQQNFVLKEENRVLKRQLNYLRNEGIFRNNQNQEKKQINDLRSTIKKQANEIKDLKIRIEMLSKQCKVYEDIIDKMEAKISRLTHDKNKLQDSLKFSKTHEKVQKSKKKSELDKDSDFMLGELNSKVGEAFSKIAELEERMRKQNEQWLEWKKQWGRQKIYYVSRIRALQKLQQTVQRQQQGESYVKIS